MELKELIKLLIVHLLLKPQKIKFIFIFTLHIYIRIEDCQRLVKY